MKKMILILVLVVGLFGTDSEEIGIPYVEKGTATIQSAVLDPNGKYFYTLKGETVTKWQLEPIKIIYSFKTGLSESKFRSGYHINISSNNKRMVIRSRGKITLWDLETKKLIKTINEKTRFGLFYNSEYITINKDREIIKYSADSLKKIKIKLPTYEKVKYLMKDKCDDFPNSCNPKYFTNKSNKLIYTAKNHVSILNANTLNITLYVAKIGDCYMTPNIDTIYCQDVMDGSKMNKINVESEEVLKIDNLLEKKYWKRKAFKINVASFEDSRIKVPPKTQSFNNNLSLMYIAWRPTKKSIMQYRYGFYDNKNKILLFTLLIFKDNSWALINKNSYFQASENTKKYLKMKTKSGEIVPINKKTFKKYNIKLKG